MATAHISGPDLLKAVQQLEPAEFDAFLSQALSSRKRSTATKLSPKESKLIQEINRGLPEEVCRRYEYLSRRRKRRILTGDGHSELLKLTHDIETRDAHRATALVELATLGEVPLRVLMKEMGIKTAPANG